MCLYTLLQVFAYTCEYAVIFMAATGFLTAYILAHLPRLIFALSVATARRLLHALAVLAVLSACYLGTCTSVVSEAIAERGSQVCIIHGIPACMH
jgi:hypothetical protein